MVSLVEDARDRGVAVLRGVQTWSARDLSIRLLANFRPRYIQPAIGPVGPMMSHGEVCAGEQLTTDGETCPGLQCCNAGTAVKHTAVRRNRRFVFLARDQRSSFTNSWDRCTEYAQYCSGRHRCGTLFPPVAQSAQPKQTDLHFE